MKYVPVATGRPFVTTRGVICSSEERWAGFTLQEGACPGWGDIPKSHVVDHVLSLPLRRPQQNEFYLSGSKWFSFDGGFGSIDFMPTNVLFANRWRGVYHAISISFTDHFIRSVQSDAERTFVPKAHLAESDPLLRELILALHRDLGERSPYGKIYGEQIGIALAAHLLRKWGRQTTTQNPENIDLGSVRFHRIRDYILSHLDEDISISRLANLSELGSDHFIRFFKKATGKTPHKYITDCRISLAVELLRSPRASIKQVGFRCGFPNQSHFVKVFARNVGVTPAKFRDNQYN